MKQTFPKLLLGGALAAAALFSSCKGGNEAVELRFNFKPGTKFGYSTVTTTAVGMEMMGQRIKTTNNMTMDNTYEVTSAEGNDKKLTMMYDRIAMTTESSMGSSMKYDSKDPASANGPLASIGSIINKPITMIVDSRGEIKQIQGMQDMMGGLDSTNPEAAAATRQIMSDSNIRGMMQQALNIYPEKPVKAGDTWQKNLTMSVSGMNMVTSNTYKLMSVKDGVAKVDVTSKIKLEGGANLPAGVQMNLSGDQSGDMDVEVATGLMTRSHMKQTIKGNMKASGMDVPIEITSDITITGTKK